MARGRAGGGPGEPPAVGARAVAAKVLVRVWSGGAFAAPALHAELRHAGPMATRDAALATELVYGVLRTQAALEERIARFTSNDRWAADPALRAHLLIAAYTLHFLDRIPAFAAVSEGVAGARAAGGPRVAAFANAVLRKLAAATAGDGPAPDRAAPEGQAKPRRAGAEALQAAVVASAPGWLRGALRRSLGRAGAEAFLAAGPVPPPAGICLAPGEDHNAWIDALRNAFPDASFEPGRVSPRAVLVRGAGDLRRLSGLPGRSPGAWIVQEEGAQVLSLSLGARPGERVLDACAGRGNKTWLLAREVVPGGAVDAADLHPAKLEQQVRLQGPEAPRARAMYAVDWTVGAGDVPEGYDRVLVDAPCSGVGTLRRRPEIALRREPADLGRLADLQVAITRRAATRARDGGRLVYAVCSVLREECEAVVDRLTAPPAEGEPGVRLEPAPFDAEVARRLAGDAAAFRLLPHEHGTDGYFAAMFVVRRAP